MATRKHSTYSSIVLNNRIQGQEFENAGCKTLMTTENVQLKENVKGGVLSTFSLSLPSRFFSRS